MLKIFGIPTMNTTKVLVTAEEIGIDYDLQLLDFSKGEHKTPAFMEIHPLGKVPAIDDDGEYLYESNAICRYLAVKHDSPLYAGDALQRARIDQWVDLFAQHMGKWMGIFFFEDYVRPNLLQSEPVEENRVEAQQFLDQQVPVVEKQLSKHAFLTGEQPSIAEIIAFSFVHIQESSSLTLAHYPHLTAWYEGFKDRKSVVKALDNYPR